MTGNKAVAYKEPGKVEVIDIDYPSFELKDGPGVNPANVGRPVNHGVILKTVATNICGSDQHMVRGRTTAPPNLVLYADWNLLKFPDKDRAMEKILDLAMLSDIFPTGFHGAVSAGVGVGSTVYVAGAGPVGLAAATSAQLLGAAVVIGGDMNEDRLAQARSFGCETVDVSKGAPQDQIEQITGVPEVDAAVDAVGFEARGHGEGAAKEAPATVLNSLMEITAAGGAIGIPRVCVTGDPGGIDEAAKVGALSLSLGTGWAKSISFTTGQCPVMRYNRGLMMAILADRVQIAKAVNATTISLDDAPQGYQ